VDGNRRGWGEGRRVIPLLLLLLLIEISDDMPSDGADEEEEEEEALLSPAALGEVVTVRSVGSSHVDVDVGAKLETDVTSLAGGGGGVVLAVADSVSSHDVELVISGVVVSDSSQVVDVAAVRVVAVSSHGVVPGSWVVPGC